MIAAIDTSVEVTIPELTVRDLPSDLLERIGLAIRRGFRDRIRVSNTTATGAPLDPVSEGWRERKAKGAVQPRLVRPARDGRIRAKGSSVGAAAISQLPLVFTGDMTDPARAWTVELGADYVRVRMHGEALEHAQNVIAIARETGRNWEDAFDGLGREELDRIHVEILKYVLESAELE